jgi:hypothetical protein
MARNSIGKTILGVAIAAACAVCASQASAASVAIPGPSGSPGGVLAPSASPYAILAPSTLENTPGGEGRAAFEGRPSLCAPGAHEVATNSGLRCKPNR